ncbi:Tat pathway signal protein [Gallibacterium genomosp. 3]|uniref:Tat pathway signal protein n=1 Tax=Gallibacterium genomosp. 3 TaxID=505345 RepID=A0A1A7PUU6_9PAST|nr:PhoX family phosphatase [Gallibacterium genomosp. 3]OBX04930.1 Tat pathway signal protein [Gallibacterium genomosp. 3]
MTRSLQENVNMNPSNNPSISEVLDVHLSRRKILKMGGIASAIALLPSAFISPNLFAASSALPRRMTSLDFTAVPFSTTDTVVVPKGYRASPFYLWGDPVGIDGNSPAFKPDASNTAEEQAAQAGMNHDGMAYFPLENGNEHGLLVMNHEYVDNGLLFPDGDKTWNADKVKKSQNAMGISIIEVKKNNGEWEVVRPSKYARRITPHTPMHLTGPARGNKLMQTAADPKGEMVLGTMQNCANGETPWGTYLTCEENWSDIFVRDSGNFTALDKRYGIMQKEKEDKYRWFEFDDRFHTDKTPNEPHRFGWVVEIDPFNPSSTPVKHTALGRFKHEGAMLDISNDGHAVVYMGDDQRFEYIYKFVSKEKYRENDRTHNMRLLSEGTLYVARFNDDGSGDWLPLIFGQNGLTVENGFENQGDLLVKTRMAADKLGATKMDRPEWIAADPYVKGNVYCTLTNNSQRGKEGKPGTDKANPWDKNEFGHIIRWQEAEGKGTAEKFTWDIFALAGNNEKGQGNIKGDAFGSPDGLRFAPNGVLWVQTDVSSSTINKKAYEGMGNNQMLAVIPEEGRFKRFLTGPNGCEITGIAFTPDNKTMFINIQHPGEPDSGVTDPTQVTAISTWPDASGKSRPRSGTVVIQKDDGGMIGS